MDIGLEVEGWYKDPYGRHENRWFSNGRATNLVRDDSATSHDEPPNEPIVGPLVRADEVEVPFETVRADDGSDPQSPAMPATMYGEMPLETTW